jgi:Uma2 family endonuclease
MAAAGILTEEDPVELLEGWLVPKMTKNPPHSSVARRLWRTLDRLLPAEYLALYQDPITTGDSAPEPDVCVVRGEEKAFEERHPAAAEVALIVEVADTSLRQDRGPKKRLYARAAIPVYWVVNLVDRRIEVHTDPTGPARTPDYRQRRDYVPGETVPIVIDAVELGSLAAAELLRT